MRIESSPLIPVFPGRRWLIEDQKIPLFFPEEKKVFSTDELLYILIEMIKMEEFYAKSRNDV
jgi:hypothetical protein